MKPKYIVEWDELQIAELPFLPNFEISAIFHVFNSDKEYEKTVIMVYPTC